MPNTLGGKKRIKRLLVAFFLIALMGFLIPENFICPVQDASKSDYNQESFWYYPWGKSVTHKGVDIFASEGQKVLSATNGIVLYKSENYGPGGKVVVVLGPKWRLHYYAHLHEIDCNIFQFLSQKQIVGKVGSTGNANGKAPHLHYSIFTPIPYPWNIDGGKQGIRKMFFVNPVQKLNSYFSKD